MWLLKEIFWVLCIKAILISPSFGQYATLITVDINGMGDFLTIQEAINDAKSYPDEPITILIKNGVYREKVRLYSWNPKITLKGESKDSTIIIYNDHFKSINLGRNSTFLTPTLSIEANDITLEQMTIINDAGPIGQAIALSLIGNRIKVKQCKIIGNQDTLFSDGENNGHYFEDTYIEGTTDYIFGGATAYFSNCILHSKSNSYITAASTPQNQKHGFVFYNCKLTFADDVSKVFLGRPWRSYAQTVFINCDYGEKIAPEGWHDWGKLENRNTVFYAEFRHGKNIDRPSWINILKEDDLAHYGKDTVLGPWINEIR